MPILRELFHATVHIPTYLRYILLCFKNSKNAREYLKVIITLKLLPSVINIWNQNTGNKFCKSETLNNYQILLFLKSSLTCLLFPIKFVFFKFLYRKELLYLSAIPHTSLNTCYFFLATQQLSSLKKIDHGRANCSQTHNISALLVPYEFNLISGQPQPTNLLISMDQEQR